MTLYACETVRAPIAQARVADMLARGWTVAGPWDEGAVLMEGPDPDGAPQPLADRMPALLAQARPRILDRPMAA